MSELLGMDIVEHPNFYKVPHERAINYIQRFNQQIWTITFWFEPVGQLPDRAIGTVFCGYEDDSDQGGWMCPASWILAD